MGWHRELLVGFDLETTGTDPREARIVTGAVIEVRGGEPIGRREWLADPGVPIPEDAVAVSVSPRCAERDSDMPLPMITPLDAV